MGRGALGQGVADGVVGIGGGDGFAVFRFALRQQLVVGIVDKERGTALESLYSWDKGTVPKLLYF